MSAERVRVVISGGGPVGLTAALALAARGIASVVVEPRAEVLRSRPRAKTLNRRTLEHLRRLGLADGLRARASLPTAWSQDIAFKETLTGRELARFTGVLGLVDDDASPERGQQIAQYVLEDLLRDESAAHQLVDVRYGQRVLGVEQDERGVDVQLAERDGTPCGVLHADYLLGADGSRGAVREAIGSRYEGSEVFAPNLGIVFTTSDLDGVRDADPLIHCWTLGPVGGMLGPMDLNGRWWAIAFGVADPAAADPVALVRGLVGRDIDLEVEATDPWTARMELADRLVVGRVALIGDAAHLNPPFGGHGVNTGIGDAVDVAWKVAAILNGAAGGGLLATYEHERRSIHRLVIDESHRNMSRLSADLVREATGDGADAGAAEERLREQILVTKRPEFFADDLVLGVQQAALGAATGDEVAHVGPCDGHDGWHVRPAPGRRLPHRWLAPGRSTLDAVGVGLTLVLVSADEPSGGGSVSGPGSDANVPAPQARTAPSQAPGLACWAAEAQALGIPLEVVHLPADVAGPGWGEQATLVRPDQVVAWRGDLAGSDESGDDAGRVLRAVMCR